MKTKYYFIAVLVAVLQTVAFIVVIPFATVKDMYEWRTKRFFNTLKFEIRSAYHTIISDFNEWKKM